MAKLIACRACGNQVSTEARACPQCGFQRNRFPLWSVPVVVILGSVAIAVCVSGGPTVPPPPAPAPAAPEPIAPRTAAPAAASPVPTPAPAAVSLPSPDEPPVRVTPEQLRRDYDGNEVSADERYRGKMLEVTGLVRAVKKDFRDRPYVELATSNQFMSVHARFANSEVDELKGFLRGDKLIIRCIGNNVVIGSPQLTSCVLEHHYRRRPAE